MLNKLESAVEMGMERAGGLDEIDHVAIPVANVAQAVEWYMSRFRCEKLYQDDTWAFLKFGNLRLAFVLPEQHPPHIAFTTPRAAEFGPLKEHRDGTRSCYIRDPFQNAVEMMAE